MIVLARVHAVLVLCCSRKTMTRIVEPALADVALEAGDASRVGRHWRARWVVVRGAGGLAAALLLHGAHVCASAALPDDAARRTAAFGGAAFVILTVLLTLPPVLSGPDIGEAWEYAELGLYLVPQSLPFSVPIALAFGIVCGWSRQTAARRMRRRVLLPGVVAIAVTLAAMEWLIPAGNQAWRTATFSRLSNESVTLPRGANEQRLSALAAFVWQDRVGASRSAQAAALEGLGRDAIEQAVHARLALCLAPVLLLACAVAIARAAPGPGLARSLFGGVSVLYVLAWMAPSQVPPVSVIWLPNGVLAAVALVIAAFTRNRARGDGRIASA